GLSRGGGAQTRSAGAGDPGVSAARQDDVAERQAVQEIDWPATAAELDSQGWAVMPRVLTPEQCRGIADLYEGGGRFRSKVVMARHGFGRGEYQYFAYPL